MNIIYLTGENEPKLKDRLDKYLEHAKKKNWPVERFSPDVKRSLGEFLSSGSLFANDRLFIVEDSRALFPKDFSWLSKNNETLSGYLIMVDVGRGSERIIKSLPGKTKIEEFPLPRLIFSFLDAFYPGNLKTAIKTLKEVEVSQPVEFIFSLLARHLRDLYWVGYAGEPFPYKESWRIAKLKKQAGKFKAGQLEKIISEVSDADILAKTSQGDLSELLDQIILTCLE